MTCPGVGFDGEMRVDGGGGWRVVSPIVLDEAQIDAGLKPRRRRAVAQGVQGALERDPGQLGGLAQLLAEYLPSTG